MATIVVMPQLGNSVESCLIVSWSVAEGDEVAENAVLCEVETDKASMEVPSTASGTVLKLLWEEGDDVPVMQPLVVLGAPGEDPAPALAEAGWNTGESTEAADGEASYEETSQVPASGAEPVEVAPQPQEDAQPEQESQRSGAGEFRGISPRARNLAAAETLDVDSIADGTGPDGRVIERDVRAALEAGPAATRSAARAGGAGQAGATGTGIGGRITTKDLAEQETAAPAPRAARVDVDADFPGPSETTKLKGVRKVISERMRTALDTAAPVTYTVTARAQGLLDLRKRFKDSNPSLGLNGVTIGDLIGYAAVRTALRHPNHNALLEDGELTVFERVHMGFACDTPRGLLVPTVRNASEMGLAEFSAVSKQLAHEAIDGSISPDLLGGATFTVSNLGSFGVEAFSPIINVPQTAILGVGAIVPRVAVGKKGKAEVEQVLSMSLSADHRVIDGADAARYLRDLVAFIEDIELAILA